MEYKTLGKSDLRVSRVGLGCNNFGGRLDLEGTRKVVHKALDLGITFFDTADSYGKDGGSESALGAVMGARRSDIVLATKFGWTIDAAKGLEGASRTYIMSAVESSLRRLKTDYFDLYQLHRPDPKTPIEETLRALDDLVKQGKVRHIGCSNLSAAQIDEAQKTSKEHGLAAFISSQNEYSLLSRGIEKELVPAIERHGLGFIPFAPIAGGMLSGKYRQNAPLPEKGRLTQSGKYVSDDRNWQIVEQLRAFCDQRGHTLLELAFSWLAAQPFVSSIIGGAMSPEQLEQNAAAAQWKLTADELAQIDRISRQG